MKRADLLNAIAARIGAKSYLEIGVLKGVTFFDVAIPRKVAVDPQFKFDRAKLSTPGCTFHQLPSDEYFHNHARSESFDLIYLDGLHTFEQTLRDLNNALRCSHRQSVIVLDDTIPNDYFASLPSQQRCLDLRTQAQLPSRAWMGDVYKTVFYIHDFLNFLSYATITENHGQTVVWNVPRSDFSPRFPNMEMLARADYGQVMELRDVMNYLPSEEIVKQLPPIVR